VPEQVLHSVDALKYNSVRVVLVGVSNESLLDKSAVYIPDPKVIAHRVCFMGYFSRSMVPEGQSSLIAEVTGPGGCDTYDISDSELADRVVGDLHRVGIIDKKDVKVIDVRNTEYGYVIHDRDHAVNIATARNYFDSIGMRLHGRFAEFEYINMDEVIRRSIELARELNEQK
jgi:protoporphyrinogen oxidase